jgi:sulfonate transport system ATP-binding protein
MRNAVRTQDAGAAVQLRGVAKRFGSNTVLSRFDLDIAAGEFVSIVGKSGCGKSTLLRLIAGLDAPTDGEITVGGVSPETAARDKVRIMFQEPRLLPWASVLDNVLLGLPEAMDETAAIGLTRAALAEVQLPDKARDWPARLSGGQKQRVALARALVSRPQLMAFDEPLGALDALTRIVMQALILTVQRDVGFTALLVTHDVAEAVALSDRVIVLDHGRVSHVAMIGIPHPRPRASAALARIEAGILDAIFATDVRAG